MESSSSSIRKGFILAGLMNMSVLLFSKLFTNPVIPEFDPVVMSNFGLLMILIWGLAYISVANNYYKVKWLIAVFAIEKFIYGFTWINWHLNNSITEVFDKDLFAGMFYAVYGVNDWIFFLFFTYVFFNLLKTRKSY